MHIDRRYAVSPAGIRLSKLVNSRNSVSLYMCVWIPTSRLVTRCNDTSTVQRQACARREEVGLLLARSIFPFSRALTIALSSMGKTDGGSAKGTKNPHGAIAPAPDPS